MKDVVKARIELGFTKVDQQEKPLRPAIEELSTRAQKSDPTMRAAKGKPPLALGPSFLPASLLPQVLARNQPLGAATRARSLVGGTQPCVTPTRSSLLGPSMLPRNLPPTNFISHQPSPTGDGSTLQFVRRLKREKEQRKAHINELVHAQDHRILAKMKRTMEERRRAEEYHQS